MKRTTILADEQLLVEVKYVAARDGKTVTQVIHEALAEYLVAHSRPRQLSIAGIGHSEAGEVSERVDEILRAEVDPVAGWSQGQSSGRGARVSRVAEER